MGRSTAQRSPFLALVALVIPAASSSRPGPLQLGAARFVFVVTLAMIQNATVPCTLTQLAVADLYILYLQALSMTSSGWASRSQQDFSPMPSHKALCGWFWG